MCFRRKKVTKDNMVGKEPAGHMKLIKTPVKVENPEIIIIGAGAAGLACAVKLLEVGFRNVRILEAESRIGGRIHTVPFAKNYIDCGARFCIGQLGNPIYELVKETDLLESCSDIHFSIQYIRSNGDIVPRSMIQKFTTIITSLMTSTRMFVFEGTLEQFIQEGLFATLKGSDRLPIPDKLVYEYLESIVKSSNFYQTSTNNYFHLKHCPGDPMLGWTKRGFIDFLDFLLKTKNRSGLGILEGHVAFNTRVSKILWQQDNGRVTVECENGAFYEADNVVVTVPLGVLKQNHQTMFQPELPPLKRNAIEGIGFRQICLVYLEFPKKFWPDNWTGFAALWRKEDLARVAAKKEIAWIIDITHIYSVKYQPNVLAAFIAGYSAKHVEGLTDSQISGGFVYFLTIFLKNMDIQMPKRVLSSKWCSNESFLGGYSFRSTETEAKKVGCSDLSQPLTIVGPLKAKNQNHTIPDPLTLKPSVLFAGEATSEKFYSTVHGAVESGLREANRLSGYYQYTRVSSASTASTRSRRHS